MLRVFLATFAGAGTAVASIAIIAMLAWPLAGGGDSLLSIAVHFIVFGAFIAFPLAFLGGIPLYYFFKWRGWLTPRSVLVGGVALSLIFPLQTWLINQSGVVSFWHFCICAVAGIAASMVFIRISGLSHANSQL